MRAGRLDKRVTIQSPATGQDAYGEPLNTWTNFVADGDGKVWASIVDLSGREYVVAAAVQNLVLTKITIRYLAGVAAKMRVVHGARIYNIEEVLGQDKQSLLLMCSRGVNNG